MKKLKKITLKALIMLTFIFVGCNSDDDAVDPVDGAVTEVNSKTYPLGSVANPDISGTAEFVELSDASVRVDLKLSNTPEGGSHPAHIHLNTAAEGGGISVSLEAIDGTTGESSTSFTALDDGTVVSYADLLDFDGYINVHLSADDLSTLVAQGDIGQNELTGEKMSYELVETAVPGISGTAVIEERVNETTLLTIELMGTPAGGMHPAHIHENDIATTGGVIVSLNPINGDTGISKTQITEFAGGEAVTYAELLAVNGYINVHLSDMDLETLVAQGNIGSN